MQKQKLRTSGGDIDDAPDPDDGSEVIEALKALSARAQERVNELAQEEQMVWVCPCGLRNCLSANERSGRLVPLSQAR